MNFEQLQALVTSIVDDHSGGIKMTELVVELVLALKEVGVNAESIKTTLIDIPIGGMTHLGILDYGMRMGVDLYREKQFVYRKLP